MHAENRWIGNILTWGVVLIVLGLAATTLGLVLASLTGAASLWAFASKYIGIVLIGLGLISLAQYTYVRRNPGAGRQMMIEEQDERLQWIRARAGQRAFWISSAMGFFLLNWLAFADQIGLPALSKNGLWFAMLGVVIVPCIVYMAGIALGQRQG